MTDWDTTLRAVAEAIEPELGRGRVADYIPALAGADPRAFGLALATPDGRVHRVGRAGQPFSIQSISKVFTLTMALERVGDDLWARVGREPSGTRFNSIVQLESEQGVPRNPLINAGAIAVTDVIVGQCGAGEAPARILDFIRRAAGSDAPTIDAVVASSERTWGDRNRALAYFMRNFRVIDGPVDAVLDAYFHQCAIAMSAADLARAGRYLAFDGLDPVTGLRLCSPEHARRINALMMTCGHYDMSGDFAFRVGLPGKSGVGGGILAVMPGVASIAVWSPALNEAGNSRAGTLALEHLAELAELNVFRG